MNSANLFVSIEWLLTLLCLNYIASLCGQWNGQFYQVLVQFPLVLLFTRPDGDMLWQTLAELTRMLN
jgi:hypothetical protein